MIRDKTSENSELTISPEISDGTIRDVLTKYGDVKGITEEQWSRIYRYPLYNGVRLVEIALQKHIPSHMIIMGNHILLSLTCYSCKKPGHQQHECPQKKTTVNNRIVTDKNTWAHVVTTGTVKRERTQRRENTERERCLMLVCRTLRKIDSPLNEGRTNNNTTTQRRTYKITASSLTFEENQYAEGESYRECDTGMVIDIQRGSMEDLGLNYMEQDPVSKPSPKQNVDRDIEKL
jgi:hypothetical protein